VIKVVGYLVQGNRNKGIWRWQ